MTKEEFILACNSLNIELNEEKMNQLERYYELLVEYNKVMNLTGITEHDQVYLKHFYDSATLVKIIDFNNVETLCDVGSGAGFPGIVLKILYPHLDVVLLDSLEKRVRFLNTVIKELGLTKIEAIHERAEDYGKNNREKFDVVTARAVAQLPVLLEYCVPLVSVGKFFIPMKGNIEEELENSKNAMNVLKVEIKSKVDFVLPKEESKRTLICFVKKDKTSLKYPRAFKEIKKKCL